MNLHAEMTDAADAAARTVGNVHESQLGRPTPCTEWDVRHGARGRVGRVGHLGVQVHGRRG